MEQKEDIRKEKLLWVEFASDGGLVHDGHFYQDTASLAFSCLKHTAPVAFAGGRAFPSARGRGGSATRQSKRVYVA
jgi:hypothetical protein